MEFQDTFVRQVSSDVVYYASELLRRAGAPHGFSTRHGGISTQAHLQHMNLGFFRGEAPEITRENYRIFAQALGFDPARTVFTNQTHTATVVCVGAAHCGVGVTKPPVYFPGTQKDDACNEVDALVCATPGMGIGIRVADCVPILFYDPVSGVAGAAHAGWRGTVGRIGEKTLEQMEACGAKRDSIYCAVGPAIGGCCYEVDDAFATRFFDTLGEEICAPCFVKRKNAQQTERYYADLKQINARLLAQAGIPCAHIDVTHACTCCDPAEFFSHRASGGKRGTMGAMIGVPEHVGTTR